VAVADRLRRALLHLLSETHLAHNILLPGKDYFVEDANLGLILGERKSYVELKCVYKSSFNLQKMVRVDAHQFSGGAHDS